MSFRFREPTPIKPTPEIRQQELCTKVENFKIKDLELRIVVDTDYAIPLANDVIRAFPNATVRQAKWRKSAKMKSYAEEATSEA